MKAVFFLFLVFSTFGIFAQENGAFSVIEKKSLKADTFVGIDSYGDWYYIKDQTLFKKTSSETFSFKDFQLGNIGSVDLLNPLKITVFFPTYQTAVILDNKLSEIQRISFTMQPPFLNVSNATTANDNRVWVFNEDTQQLGLFNYRTGNYQALSVPISEDYITQKSNFNYCFLLTDKQLRLYNIYGSLLQGIPSGSAKEIAISQHWVVLKSDTSIKVYSAGLTGFFTLKNTEIDIKDLYLTDDFLYLYDGEFLHKTKLTETQD